MHGLYLKTRRLLHAEKGTSRQVHTNEVTPPSHAKERPLSLNLSSQGKLGGGGGCPTPVSKQRQRLMDFDEEIIAMENLLIGFYTPLSMAKKQIWKDRQGLCLPGSPLHNGAGEGAEASMLYEMVLRLDTSFPVPASPHQ